MRRSQRRESRRPLKVLLAAVLLQSVLGSFYPTMDVGGAACAIVDSPTQVRGMQSYPSPNLVHTADMCFRAAALLGQ